METLQIASPDGLLFENTLTAENKIVETDKEGKMRIDYPKEGGRLVWFRGHPYPEKYFPTPTAIYLCDAVKRLLMTIIRVNWRLLLAIGQGNKLRELCWHTLRHIAFKSEHIDKYCDAGREIYKVGVKYFNEQWVHIGVIIAEYDNGWRYRWQSLLPFLDKNSLDSPVRELRRLLKLGGGWEQDKSIERKWLMIRRTVLILYILPKTRRRLVAFLRGLDMDKIKLGDEDKFWCFHWQIFDFCGKSFEERLKVRECLKLARLNN